MTWVRFSITVGITLALLATLAGEGFAQQGDRAVRVQGHQAPGTEQRVALVIGNSAYTRISKLRNPVNDAQAMTRVLKLSGFQVTTLIDADRRGMLRAITRFGKQLRNGGVGLFYFAGHGVQARGRNYLIPLGAEVEDVPDLEYEAVDAGRVLGKMESAKNRLNIVILDACRNNPYGSAFRSARHGLAQVNAPSGSLVAYATGPGKVAADGNGKNGLYTEQLVRHLRTPGLKLEEVFKRVRIDVQRLSGGKQVPWENTSVTGDFYFARAKVVPTRPIVKTQQRPAAQPRQSINAEEESWADVKLGNTIEDYQDYLSEYPQGRFASIAKRRIRRLKRKAAFTQRPPQPPQQAALRQDSSKPPWRDPVTGMEFIIIPGGSFQMGCHSNAGQCDDHEKPMRTVRLDRFWLGRNEVTVGQFKLFVMDSGYKTEAEKGDYCFVYAGKWMKKRGASWRNPGFQQDAKHPVVCVTWNDTQAFAKWLSRKTEQHFRLPSEAQWEFACRAGGKPVRFGTDNGKMSSGNSNYGKINGGTTPVGRYQTNGIGLHDMSGNVWEWVQDKQTSYKNVGTDNPIYEGAGSNRVFRGGGWTYESGYHRCSVRSYHAVPSLRGFGLGFRLVRVR